MATFRARLDRLGPWRDPPTPRPAGSPPLAAPSRTAPAERWVEPLDPPPQRSARAVPPAAEPSAKPTLEALRDRMAALLAATPSARTPPADPSHGELPFFREETERGPLYRRVVHLPASHRVGRAPTSPARSADPAMLALLALDPTLAALDPSRALYLDTETTGLAGGTGTVPFLVGMISFPPGGSGLCMEQLLLRRLGEEAPILERVREALLDASMLVTFNGKRFDWPLLRARFVMNRLPPPEPPAHLDLLHVARRIHRPRLERCSLASLEEGVLGYGRTGDVSGGDIVARYAHFLRSGDDGALREVVDHNAWDVASMVALVALYGEPLDGLPADDLLGVARTLRRAGALAAAAETADLAIARGGGMSARRERGAIRKARGDRAGALADYEALLDDLDDPSLRLELAKLYEHYLKEPGRALEMVERGVGEKESAAARRRRRLLAKLARACGGGRPLDAG